MPERRVYIRGAGLIAPHVRDCGEAALFCAEKDPPISREVADVPLPESVKPRDARWLSRLSRLCLYAADRACNSEGFDRDNAALVVALTHGSTSFLREFHDLLFDYGPTMASPNAFSNGVTNASLGVVSRMCGPKEGGVTLVGYEQCGMDALVHAGEMILGGHYGNCCVGGGEEYSPVVAEAYHRLGWFTEPRPSHLPAKEDSHEGGGFPVSEASVFFALSSQAGTGSEPRCEFCPIADISTFEEQVDIVVSGAGGGPQDACEMAVIDSLFDRQKHAPGLLFSKCYFGETFAVGALLSTFIAYDIIQNKASYRAYPPEESLAGRVAPEIEFDNVRTVLVVAGGRDKSVSAGLVKTG